MRYRYDTSAATVDTTIPTNDIGNDGDEFEVQCDYLVVGAGLAGLSFIDVRAYPLYTMFCNAFA